MTSLYNEGQTFVSVAHVDDVEHAYPNGGQVWAASDGTFTWTLNYPGRLGCKPSPVVNPKYAYRVFASLNEALIDCVSRGFAPINFGGN